MLVCACVGSLLASPQLDQMLVVAYALVGTGLIAASAAVINHLYDVQVDSRMTRTQNRPVATGRLSLQQGVVFAVALGFSGFVVLHFLVNPLTAWLNAFSWVGYAFVYTMWLKYLTPQNIVWGGLFGAAPPLFGWTAITGHIAWEPLILVVLIFLWTPPHFWALALAKKEEYVRAEIPMLPVTHGETATKQQIFIYTILTVLVSLLPTLLNYNGTIYLLTAIALGTWFIWRNFRLLKGSIEEEAMRSFRYSVVYLACLFGCLLVDHFYYVLV